MRKNEIKKFMGNQNYIVASEDGICYVNGSIADITTLLTMIFYNILDATDETTLDFIIDIAKLKMNEVELKGSDKE